MPGAVSMRRIHARTFRMSLRLSHLPRIIKVAHFWEPRCSSGWRTIHFFDVVGSSTRGQRTMMRKEAALIVMHMADHRDSILRFAGTSAAMDLSAVSLSITAAVRSVPSDPSSVDSSRNGATMCERWLAMDRSDLIRAVVRRHGGAGLCSATPKAHPRCALSSTAARMDLDGFGTLPAPRRCRNPWRQPGVVVGNRWRGVRLPRCASACRSTTRRSGA